MTLYFAIAAVLLMVLLAAGLVGFTWNTARRVTAAVGPLGRLVDVAGVTFHVHEQGTGPTLLLIHGLGGQMRHFTYGVVERLAPRFRVVSIDRPGSGYSVRATHIPADLATQAAAVAGLIGQMQLGPVTVVGHSLGGAVALTLALNHPACVAGLALVAPLTHLPGDGTPPAAFRALLITSAWRRMLFAWTLATPASIAGRRIVLEQIFGPDPVPRDFATRGGGLLSLRPSQFIAASRDIQALQANMPATSSRYRQLKIPVRILFGRSNRILDWQLNGQGLVDRVDGAALMLVDGGHMLPVTMPELTAGFIEDTANLVTSTDATRADHDPSQNASRLSGPSPHQNPQRNPVASRGT